MVFFKNILFPHCLLCMVDPLKFLASVGLLTLAPIKSVYYNYSNPLRMLLHMLAIRAT